MLFADSDNPIPAIIEASNNSISFITSANIHILNC
jgi:hypothetical protein